MAAGLDVEHLAIPEVLVVTCRRHGDDRGFFSETYNRDRFREAGITMDFVQDNHAYSAEKGTVRGLHFQTPPFAQDKLVRVVRGAILDIAVDLRTGSPTYGRYVSAVISAKAWNQILVPVGFAHGLVTLEPDTEVLYKVSNVYSPEHDKGLLWNDPALGIDWGLAEEEAILSAKDKTQPRLADLPAYFSSDKDQSR
ncbi:dTDP-4-dehydrorhamnose 3,5-epimerase [Aurantimonas sp. VKM B-3413]|uniref:dTDP-4-dehydrorhamnose 3,5-epimerase n=1 Tax=Aurantimonas sp. VKM B-3413 TaxID=2779401 RepID=UPI001E4337AF|nr:dTDP-4-dehydrorhamnose 3,5-epimerase [Aurantimonas sp. VKM B-3413]MCB8839379.1 dTDP-4-dehydrorhamnose 3,5-epimerase [Aurantimonas sp. VKM B-3413]